MAEIFLYPQDRSEQYLVKMAHLGRRVGALKKHPHRYAELMVALEGQVVDIIDDREHYTKAGYVYVLYPGMLHEQRDAQGYRYAIFKFEQEDLMAEAEQLRSLSGFHLLFSMEGVQHCAPWRTVPLWRAPRCISSEISIYPNAVSFKRSHI